MRYLFGVFKYSFMRFFIATYVFHIAEQLIVFGLSEPSVRNVFSNLWPIVRHALYSSIPSHQVYMYGVVDIRLYARSTLVLDVVVFFIAAFCGRAFICLTVFFTHRGCTVGARKSFGARYTGCAGIAIIRSKFGASRAMTCA